MFNVKLNIFSICLSAIFLFPFLILFAAFFFPIQKQSFQCYTRKLLDERYFKFQSTAFDDSLATENLGEEDIEGNTSVSGFGEQ